MGSHSPKTTTGYNGEPKRAALVTNGETFRLNANTAVTKAGPSQFLRMPTLPSIHRLPNKQTNNANATGINAVNFIEHINIPTKSNANTFPRVGTHKKTSTYPNNANVK